jgi:hypothetical protein
LKNFIYKNCIALSIVWALIILALCSAPGQLIPNLSWLELLSFDKWVHAGMFFILCSLLFIVSIKKAQPKPMLFMHFFICILYGGLLEIMQAKFFSNRSADWQDFAANNFGCFLAVFLLKKLRNIFRFSS